MDEETKEKLQKLFIEALQEEYDLEKAEEEKKKQDKHISNPDQSASN